jgi:hypothetical protein
MDDSFALSSAMNDSSALSSHDGNGPRRKYRHQYEGNANVTQLAASVAAALFLKYFWISVFFAPQSETFRC